MRILTEVAPKIKPKSDWKTSAKIVGKNVLHDAIAGGLFGASTMGYRNKVGMVGKGALLGTAIGAVSGLGEGLVKHKLFKNKSPEQVKKIVSHPGYKGLNVGLTSGYHTAVQSAVNRAIGEKMGWKGAAAALGIGALEDIASTANDSKVYGADAPDTVGAAKLFNKDSLKTGMFSKKKYKYGGLGPEIKKRKTNKTV